MNAPFRIARFIEFIDAVKVRSSSGLRPGSTEFW